MSSHRMSMPQALTPQEAAELAAGQPGPTVWLEGDEAHHAVRVKRLGGGDTVELLDGSGWVCQGVIEQVDKRPKTRDGGGWTIGVRMTEAHRVARLSPEVELCVAVPKGERFETMASMVSQVGVATLRALETKRTVSDPRPGKLDRVRRICAESAKQCGRAWTLEIAPVVTFERAIEPAGGTSLVLADASGGSYQPTGSGSVRLLIGPEGGWTDKELARARAAGAQIASFGAHVMRIETAAVVASAAVLIAERVHKER